MKSLRRVLIMAGGTGGHVFPGLAVANYLREQGVAVHWLGTAQGLEAHVVPPADIPLHFISIGGVRGKSMKTWITAPFRVMMALGQALRILLRVKPDVVIGMGGFASGPGGLASWLLRYPLVIHEQNAKSGLTNRWLKKMSHKVLTGFPGVFREQLKVEVIGNPVRKELIQLPPPAERFHQRSDRLHLLILGGSLGARAINELVPRSMALLASHVRPAIQHQAGNKLYEEAVKAYQQAGVEATVVPFMTDMAAAYAWADLVLCRAGALTIAELCAVGLGSILVPFPYAVDDHQTANAQFLADKGAAFLVQQSALSVERLAQLITDLQAQPEKRLAMAEAAYRLRQVRVSERIYEVCKAI
jgi:UDP-N-acetylglucosamine--N-acetylmuramyl-(pentapeptide) pyrophosphoryl-undecaprenol N-acetylglucosamine transferase